MIIKQYKDSTGCDLEVRLQFYYFYDSGGHNRNDINTYCNSTNSLNTLFWMKL